MKTRNPKTCVQLQKQKEHVDYCVNCGDLVFSEEVNEDLRKWFKDKWVRFGPDGKVRGQCARGSK